MLLLLLFNTTRTRSGPPSTENLGDYILGDYSLGTENVICLPVTYTGFRTPLPFRLLY